MTKLRQKLQNFSTVDSESAHIIYEIDHRYAEAMHVIQASVSSSASFETECVYQNMKAF